MFENVQFVVATWGAAGEGGLPQCPVLVGCRSVNIRPTYIYIYMPVCVPWPFPQSLWSPRGFSREGNNPIARPNRSIGDVYIIGLQCKWTGNSETASVRSISWGNAGKGIWKDCLDVVSRHILLAISSQTTLWSFTAINIASQGYQPSNYVCSLDGGDGTAPAKDALHCGRSAWKGRAKTAHVKLDCWERGRLPNIKTPPGQSTPVAKEKLSRLGV